MKNKIKLLSLFACCSIACVGAIAMNTVGNVSMFTKGLSNNTPQSYIVLNNGNKPSISRGTASKTIGFANVIYNNVIESQNGHVMLLKGGYLMKDDSSKALDYITATFTGSLRLYTGFSSADHFSYELSSGVKQKVCGNYFKLVADEITDLTSLDVCYGCSSAQSNTTMLNGKDFFDGYAWYTATGSGSTEQGTPIGDALLLNNELRFYRDPSGRTHNVVGHIDLFRATENLYVYNTNANKGIYKPFTNYMDEFNEFNGVQYSYKFGMKAVHSFAIAVGGAVGALLKPWDGKAYSDYGVYLATYLKFDGVSKKVDLIQGATNTSSRSFGSFSGDTTFKFDRSEQEVEIRLTRYNNPETPTRSEDKLIFELYVNGSHVEFVDSGTGTTGECCRLDENGNYVFQYRLFEETTYGPYFGVYPNTSGDTAEPDKFDVRISSFSWNVETLEEMPVYGILDASTFVQSGAPNGNYSTAEVMQSFRPGGNVYKDAYLRFNMSNIWNDYSSTTRDKSNAKLHIVLHCVDKYENVTSSDLGFLMLRCNTYTSRSDIDWDPTTVTWNNRGDALPYANMIARNNYKTFTYDSGTDILDVSIDFNTEEITRYIDKQNSDNLMTVLIGGKSDNFRLQFYSVNASPELRPVVYLTY